MKTIIKNLLKKNGYRLFKDEYDLYSIFDMNYAKNFKLTHCDFVYKK